MATPANRSEVRILIADDEPQIRKLFARKLRNAGYSVSEAKTGAEALILLRGIRFRLLLLDLDMPDTDGFEVLKTVRSEFPHVPVLVISGYMQGALLKAAECFGAVWTLEKAAAPQLLVPTVRKLLGDSE
jgi:CheY-like chemotaxis protein